MTFTIRQLLAAAIFITLLSGCRKPGAEQRVDWQVTLAHDKTTPYGASLAYESLKDYFPSARREVLSPAFRYSNIDEHLYGNADSASLLVLLGLNFQLRPDEWGALLRFAASGNEVFLLSSDLDTRVAHALELLKLRPASEEDPPNTGDRVNIDVLQLASDTGKRFGYLGRTISSFFRTGVQRGTDEKAPSDDDDVLPAPQTEAELNLARMEAMIRQPPRVLGRANGNPDFLRFRVGKGHITLHAAPLVLSNYFLLQPGNCAYLDGIWHSFPARISAVYWNDFFRRRESGTHLSVLLKYPAMRRALLLASLALLLYVIFGMKRRQRIVPILAQPENTSAIFAETVGRLYFNKGDHANLAGKMMQHFLDFVRSHYFLDTSQMNNDFVRLLSAKSGRPEAEVASLVARMHELRLGAPVSAEYLYQLYHDLQLFYKTA